MAVFACGLEASSTETKGTVLIRNGEELMNYNRVCRESNARQHAWSSAWYSQKWFTVPTRQVDWGSEVRFDVVLINGGPFVSFFKVV